jgi:hypothetical protein
MNIDLIGSVTLTASAAIMIAALSVGFGSTAMVRTRIAAWLTAWFVFVVILAATRALYYEGGLGAPGLGVAVALPIAVLCIVVARAHKHCAKNSIACRSGFSSAFTWFACSALVL